LITPIEQAAEMDASEYVFENARHTDALSTPSATLRSSYGSTFDAGLPPHMLAALEARRLCDVDEISGGTRTMDLMNEIFQRQARRLEIQLVQQVKDRKCLESAQLQLVLGQREMQNSEGKNYELCKDVNLSADSVCKMQQCLEVLHDELALSIGRAESLFQEGRALANKLKGANEERADQLYTTLSEVMMCKKELCEVADIGHLFNRSPSAEQHSSSGSPDSPSIGSSGDSDELSAASAVALLSESRGEATSAPAAEQCNGQMDTFFVQAQEALPPHVGSIPAASFAPIPSCTDLSQGLLPFPGQGVLGQGTLGQGTLGQGVLTSPGIVSGGHGLVGLPKMSVLSEALHQDNVGDMLDLHSVGMQPAVGAHVQQGVIPLIPTQSGPNEEASASAAGHGKRQRR